MKLAAAAALVCAAVPAVAQPQFAAQFPGRILAAHNAARAQVGAPPLVWDNDLGTAAGQYAQQMALTGVFEHSNRAARRGIGENLWMGSHNAYGVETMVGGWVGERRYFMPGIFPNNSSNGNWISVAHYTQLIWPTTTRIGCAVASNGRTDYLVCRYATAGNIDGRWVGPGRGERG
ncbi:MAG: CAP domain-containing protein [Sphingomicrobium sp.]